MQNASPPFVSIPQELFGGLYTEASPNSLPLGASPRCLNCDFTIGQVDQRPGLESIFAFTSNATGPNLATMGANVPVLSGTPWISPNNIAIAGYASLPPTTVSDILFASLFNFSLENLEIQGIVIGITGHQGGSGSGSVYITNGAGVQVGLA